MGPKMRLFERTTKKRVYRPTPHLANEATMLLAAIKPFATENRMVG